jgi:hypothetical protein
MNHIDKQTFIFVKSVFFFSEQVFRRFFLHSFAPRDHLHDFRFLKGKVCLLDNIRYERIPRIVASDS